MTASARLGDVAQVNPRLTLRPAPDELISFLGMAGVDAETGTTAEGETRTFSEVAKGYTHFRDHDILLAKITPCFENGKIAQAKLAHPIGVGSTEFHVIRPDPARLDARFALHLLRRREIRRSGQKRMTGSGGQRRVPEAFIADIAVPMLPIEEQRRVAAILDHADALRAKRREALAHLDSLGTAIFIDMFGDPITNPIGFSRVRVGELLALKPNYGSMVPATEKVDRFISLRVASIQDWRIDLSSPKYIDLASSDVLRHTVKDGDVLLARAIATEELLGKMIVAMPGDQLWSFDSHLMRLRFDTGRILPEFFQSLFATAGGRRIFLKASRRSLVQFNINTGEVCGLEIPLPALDDQAKFKDRLVHIAQLRHTHSSAVADLDSLFASIQQRAFSGELYGGSIKRRKELSA